MKRIKNIVDSHTTTKRPAMTTNSAAAKLVVLSIAAAIITIVAVPSNSTVVEQPVEDAETRFLTIEQHLRCMWTPASDDDFFNNPCRFSFMLVQDKYMGIGRISYEYVEALNIYYNYNHTAVEFHLCDVAPNRCPDHIKPQHHYLRRKEFKDLIRKLKARRRQS